MPPCLVGDEAVVSCQSCRSRKQLFNGEVAIHFPGHDGLAKPIVRVFPKLTVCLDCGAAQFNLPEREIAGSRDGAPVDRALVSSGGGESGA